jgi:diguanylate cyclase (GGDEF)-like protein/PAS domain S-box-containing protein
MGSSPNSTAVVTSIRPSTRRAGRLPQSLGSPLVLAYAIGPLCLVPLWVLRDLHLIADLPMWLYAVVLLVPSCTVSTASNVLYARHPSKLTLHARAASDSIATTVVIYATGWGPELGLVYLVAAQHLIGTTGLTTWRYSRFWALVGVACGQVGIAVGWVPSFVHSPVDNGAAALGLFAFLLVSRMAMTIFADRERAWEEVRASEGRFRSLVHSSSDMIMVLDETGQAIYVSGACERILGLTAEQVRSTDLTAMMHPDEVDAVRDCLSAAITRSEPTMPIEMRVRHLDRQWRNLEIVGTNLRDNPAVGGVVLNVRDVTDRRRAEAELAHHATHDSLTGLPNRPLFLERLGESLNRHKWSSRRPAVLFLDVDRFKLINDSLGHEIGDQLLVEASRRLRAAVGPEDTVARFGGDEFVVLCSPVADPIEVAGRLLATFDEPFRLGGQTYFLSASIGVASPESTHSRPTELIRDADTAMYRAKEMGRGRLAVFDEAARAAAVTRIHTEHLLRGAADRGELRLYYQPVLDLESRQVVAAEALLRWQHPEMGLVGPVDFIDVAEDSGLIVPIGDWVLERACSQARAWARRGEAVEMAVNVSARQLADDHFLAAVSQIVDPVRDGKGPQPPITLEITERVLIRDPDSVGARLEQLKALGLKLAMDDFGTGYSSLSNLRRYPFDSLKIDRRFVSGVADREDDATIVRAIIALAHGLGKTVVAEGVETAGQLAILAELGCDLAQGFHIGEPRPATSSPSDLLLPEHRDRAILSPAG